MGVQPVELGTAVVATVAVATSAGRAASLIAAVVAALLAKRGSTPVDASVTLA
jgi:hypothetical protein